MKSFVYIIVLIYALLSACSTGGNIYHVSPDGNDSNTGTEEKPVKSVSAAVNLAQPGDSIVVHEGTYRERINPYRGGTSKDKRIVYQAAPGEKVIIKGSEPVNGWKHLQADTWKVIIPNSFFGDFNPYNDTIIGDWFNRWGRTHHTGAVYLDGDWLTEASTLEEVSEPADSTAMWYAEADSSTGEVAPKAPASELCRPFEGVCACDRCKRPSCRARVQRD